MVNPRIRVEIFERDNYTCQDCGRKGEWFFFRNYDLDVHHMDGNGENNNYENLITLCDECHFNAHGRNWQHKPIKSYTVKETIEAEEEYV